MSWSTLDYDHAVSDNLRFVQLTPTGSACSIAFGVGLTDQAPGRRQCQLVVSDIDEARGALSERGVEVSEVQEFDWGKFRLLQRPTATRAVQQLPR